MSELRHKQAPQWRATPAIKQVEGRRLPLVLPYIYAEAQPAPDAPANSPTIREALYHLEKAVAEAWQASKESGGKSSDQLTSMRLTWMACLPPLDCVHNIRIYTAMISWAKTHIDISHAELKSYAYLVQVALQAMNAQEPTE